MGLDGFLSIGNLNSESGAAAHPTGGCRERCPTGEPCKMDTGVGRSIRDRIKKLIGHLKDLEKQGCTKPKIRMKDNKEKSRKKLENKYR